MIGPGSGYVWILVNPPSFGTVLFQNQTVFVNGTLAIAIPEQYEMPDVRAALLQMYNNISADASLSNQYYYYNTYTGTDSPTGLGNNLLSYFQGGCAGLNAVFTVAHALHQLIYEAQVEYAGDMLMSTLKSVDFVGPCGQISFNQDGEMKYSLSMGNQLYYRSNGAYSLVTVPFDTYATKDDVNYLPNDTIPMSINLTRVTMNGTQQAMGQWIPDFTCDGGCGQGWCVGYNDCQCQRGWTQSIQSNGMTTSPCDTAEPIRDDTIQWKLPKSLFLLTRAYEEALNAAVASLFNISQYGPDSDSFMIYEFRLYTSAARNNVILDSNLKTLLNQSIQSNSGAVPLSSYFTSASVQVNVQPRASLVADDTTKLVILIVIGIFVFIWLLVLVLSMLLFGSPWHGSGADSLQRRRSLSFSWMLNGTSLFGTALSIAGVALYAQQPNNINCNIAPWFLFLSLQLVVNVKLAKLYRLHCIFNNPQLKRIQLTESKLMLIVVLPLLVAPFFVLALQQIIAGPAQSILETDASVALVRDRAWICQRSMSTQVFESILVVWYLVTTATGALLRYLCRHVQRSFVDPIYSDLILFIVIPWLFAPWWLSLRLWTSGSISPVLVQSVTVAWLYTNGVCALLLQFVQRFISVMYKEVKIQLMESQGDFRTLHTLGNYFHHLRHQTVGVSKQASSSNLQGMKLSNGTEISAHSQSPLKQIGLEKTPNHVSMASMNALNVATFALTESTSPAMKCRAAHIGRFLTGRWRDYEIKSFQVPHQKRICHWLGLFFQRPPKDSSGIIFTEATLLNVMEIDPSSHLLRLFTKQDESYLIQVQDAKEYASLVQQLSQLLQAGNALQNSSTNSLASVQLLQEEKTLFQNKTTVAEA